MPKPAAEFCINDFEIRRQGAGAAGLIFKELPEQAVIYIFDV